MAGPLIIAGFHRSGTSAAARVFHYAGVFMGEDLVGARLSNPFGHYEDTAVVALHDALLSDNGRTWQVDQELLPTVLSRRWEEMRALAASREAGHPLWGFKDPRVCLFVQAWKHLLPEARLVIVFRHFAAAVDSLHRREARLVLTGAAPVALHRRFWEVPGLALRMWLVHNRALLEFALAHRGDVLAVSFEALREGMPLAACVEERWGLGLRPIPTFEAVQPGLPAGRPPPIRLVGRQLLDEAEAVLADLQALEQETGEGGGGAR